MYNGCGPKSCTFDSLCAHDATHWISKAKQCSCGPARAFKTQSKSECVEKHWLLAHWLKGAFKEHHLKQFCKTQCIEIAPRSRRCNWLNGDATAGKERLVFAAAEDSQGRLVSQVACHSSAPMARLPKFPFLLLPCRKWGIMSRRGGTVPLACTRGFPTGSTVAAMVPKQAR